MARPSVTFLIICYNQSDTIAEAVESALAQTYAPLEIIISDDHSPDDTFLRITDIVGRYRGPHTVRLNQNPRNLHPGHVRSIWHMVNSEICVLGNGDDVFFPRRVEASVEAMMERNVSVVTCNPQIINARGDVQGPAVHENSEIVLSLRAFFETSYDSTVLGAAMSWHREVFDFFGLPLLTQRDIDQNIGFRGALLRGGWMIREPLMSWRHHDKNSSLYLQMQNATSPAEEADIHERTLCNMTGIIHTMLHDLNFYLERRPDDPRRAELLAGRATLERRLAETSRDWVIHRYDMARKKFVSKW
ncbi:MAG: glycosyltransferase [Azospirillaceae bacterium]|nr:glycosyltransferase [Azospirillaceae bacterium]